MKRGFLNSKKVKHQPLYDNVASTTKTTTTVPPTGPGQTTTTVSHSPNMPSKSKLAVTVQKVTIGPPNLLSKVLEPYSIIRIPSLELTKSKESFSSCIIRASTCSAIMSTPGYLKPLPTAKPADTVFTKTTPDMCIGLFAKHDVKCCQAIFSERPLLVFPTGMTDTSADLTAEEVLKKSLLMSEKRLQQALDIMTKEDANAYRSLANCHPEGPELDGIALTNAYGANKIEQQNIEEGMCGYSAVGKLASRINHCCTPNVTVEFDVATFALQITALRKIKAGEQLFACYCDPYRPAKERSMELAKYGFDCQCRACVTATPNSDKLREEVDDRIKKIIDGKAEMLADPRFSIHSLDPLLKFEEDIMKEELHFNHNFAMLLYTIMEGYGQLYDAPKAFEYFNKVNNWGGQLEL